MCEFCDPSSEAYPHAQNWYTEKFEEAYPDLANNPISTPSPSPAPNQSSKKLKTRVMKHKRRLNSSFVKSKVSLKSGVRVIQIKVLDLLREGDIKDDIGEDDDRVALSAQYIVRDPVDNIMDSTESLISKISKSLVENKF